MLDQAEKKSPDVTGLLVGLAAAPLYFLLSSLGYRDAGRTAGLCLGMILIAVKLRWDLRKYYWFWIAIAFVSLLHLPLIIALRWPDYTIPGIALLPLGAADLLIILGVIRLVERFTTKSNSSEEEEVRD